MRHAYQGRVGLTVGGSGKREPVSHNQNRRGPDTQAKVKDSCKNRKEKCLRVNTALRRMPESLGQDGEKNTGQPVVPHPDLSREKCDSENSSDSEKSRWEASHPNAVTGQFERKVLYQIT